MNIENNMKVIEQFIHNCYPILSKNPDFQYINIITGIDDSPQDLDIIYKTERYIVTFEDIIPQKFLFEYIDKGIIKELEIDLLLKMI